MATRSESIQLVTGMRRVVRCGVALGVFGAMILVPAAQAANLTINDTVPHVIALTNDGNWEFGVVSNGTPFAPSVVGRTRVAGENASFSGSWIAPGVGNPSPGTGVIYFVEAGNPTQISDIITASWSSSGAIASISFSIQSSGSSPALGTLPPAFAGLGIVETGNLIGIEGLFRDPNTGAPVSIPSNLTVQFGSDVDRSNAPAMSHVLLGVVALLLLGGGVWLTRRRHPVQLT